jgi:hypothetical protein
MVMSLPDAATVIVTGLCERAGSKADGEECEHNFLHFGSDA